MSKEKGTPAQKGTGSSTPMIQKLHTTGEKNVKFKMNASAARLLATKKGWKTSFGKTLRSRLASMV
jgi:hypothetical protein